MSGTVRGINPDGTLDVETPSGTRVPVVRGTIPELDAQAASMGGGETIVDMFRAAPQPAPDLTQPGMVADNRPIAAAPVDRLRPPPVGRDTRPLASPDPEMAANASAARDREYLHGTGIAGPRFEGGQQAQQGPRLIVGRAGGGGGGPQRRETLSQEYSMPIAPEYGEAMQAAGADVERAQMGVAEQQAQLAMRQAERQRQYAAEMDAQRGAREQVEREHADRMERAQVAVDDALKHYQALGEDPYAFRGTGARLAAAIGMALSTIGSALSGSENRTWDIIQSQIDNEMSVARDALQARRGQLGELRDRLGDDRAALAAHEAAVRQRLDQDLATYAAEAQSGDIKSQIQLVQAQNRQAQAAAAAEAAQRAAGTVAVEQTRRSGGGAGRGRQMLMDPVTGAELTTEQAIKLGYITGPGGEGGDDNSAQGQAFARQMTEISDADQALTRVLRSAEDGSLPGFGATQSVGRWALDRALPEGWGEGAANLLTSEQGLSNRADVDVLVERLTTAITGATATPEQKVAFRAQYGLTPGAGQSQIIRGLRQAQADLRQRQRILRAGAGRAVTQRFDREMQQQSPPELRTAREVE